MEHKKKQSYKLHETNLINLNYPRKLLSLLCKKMSYTTQFLSSLVEIISSYSPRVGRAVVSSNPGVSCRVLLQPMIDGVSLSDKNLNLGHFTSFDKSEGKNRIYKFLAALSIEGLSKCGSVCQLLVEVQHRI